jgi:hypothetical protein
MTLATIGVASTMAAVTDPNVPSAAESPPLAPAPATPSPGSGPLDPSFEHRFEQRMEGLGREVEDAAQRWSKDPGVTSNLTMLGRLWGLVLLAVGAWLFAGVTLGYDLPSVPVRDLWPLLLIVLGALVLVRGLARRT